MDLIAKRDLGFTPSPQLSYKREIEVKHSNFDSRLETHTFEHVESPSQKRFVVNCQMCNFNSELIAVHSKVDGRVKERGTL